MIDIQWHPSPGELRKFGLIVIVGFCIIGAVCYWGLDEQMAGIVAVIAGGVLGLPALTGTVIALPGYWLWMGIAFVMGNIMSRVLLTLLWFLLMTPIGILRRTFFSDVLLRKGRGKQTYWRAIPPSTNEKSYYERLT